jgi:hypothetical protein
MNFKQTTVYLSLIVLLMISNLSFGQISVKSVRIAITGNNLTDIPKYNHLGFSTGVNFMEKQGKHFKKTFGVELSYYKIKKMEQSVILDATYSFGYVFKFGLETKLLADLGYKYSAFTGDVYEFSNGQYQETNKIAGQSQLNLKLGFGLEYPLNNKFSIYTHAKVIGYTNRLLNLGHAQFFFINQELSLGIKYNLIKKQ